MIFVTVGSTHFDDLIRSVDESVAQRTISDTVVLQIGYGGAYLPKHCRYFRGAPTLEPFERAADLVIGHGGTGTTLEVLLMGRPLISVANPALKDNHQHLFLDALERAGLVTYCRHLEDLSRMVSSFSRDVRQSPGTSTLAGYFGQTMRGLVPVKPTLAEHAPRRLAERFVQRYEAPVANLAHDDHERIPWEIVLQPADTAPVQKREAVPKVAPS